MTLRKILFCAILIMSTKAWAQVYIEPEVLCWYRSQPWDTLCPKLSHLKMRADIPWDDSLTFKLAYDPGSLRKITWYDTYTLRVQQLPPRKSWLSDYGVRFQFAPRWDLSIEDWTATTLLPDASGLSYSRALQDAGWNQTAMRLSYVVPDGVTATAILGLGEGKRLEDLDSQPYLGALIRIPLISAFDLQVGASLDKDSLHPDALWWFSKEERKKAAENVQAKRLSAALVLDGTLTQIRGLQASVGWQQNQIRSNRDDWLSTHPLPAAIDPTEALPNRGSLKKESLLFSASYQILAEYIVAFHLSNLKLSFDDAEIFSCSLLDQDGLCIDSRISSHELHVRGLTFGIGKIDVDGWSLLLESHEERYDRLYESYHFASGTDQRQEGIRIISARLAWTW